MTPTKYSIAPGHPGPRKVSPNMRTDIGPWVSSNAGRVTVSRYGTSRAWAQRGNGTGEGVGRGVSGTSARVRYVILRLEPRTSCVLVRRLSFLADSHAQAACELVGDGLRGWTRGRGRGRPCAAVLPEPASPDVKSAVGTGSTDGRR